MAETNSQFKLVKNKDRNERSSHLEILQSGFSITSQASQQPAQDSQMWLTSWGLGRLPAPALG